MQSSYKSGHSTETALLKLQNDVALDKDHGMLLVTLDYSTAFDTISHNIIIKHLYEELGVMKLCSNGSKHYLAHRTPNLLRTKSSLYDHIGILGSAGLFVRSLLFSVYIQPL